MPSFTQILNTSRIGMLSRLMNLDVVSHNLSNVTTTGFKRGRANFQEMLESQQLGGVQVQSTQFMMQQGNLQKTANPLDLAIQGEGFFSIRLPDGRTAYTRDGRFFLDANSQIVTSDGFQLAWDGQVPAGAEDVRVDRDGTVNAMQNGVWTRLGTVQLARFANPSGMTRYGQNIWLETPISGTAQLGAAGAQEVGTILGSTLEGSNVSLAEEMVTMMNLQRSFEVSLRTFQQTDQMFAEAIHMRKA
jgi:flagellar basal-body rod protein FlgG